MHHSKSKMGGGASSDGRKPTREQQPRRSTQNGREPYEPRRPIATATNYDSAGDRRRVQPVQRHPPPMAPSASPDAFVPGLKPNDPMDSSDDDPEEDNDARVGPSPPLGPLRDAALPRNSPKNGARRYSPSPPRLSTPPRRRVPSKDAAGTPRRSPSYGPSPPARRATASDSIGKPGRCVHCPHCQSTEQVELPRVQPGQPPWILRERPPEEYSRIDMDKYDEDAVRARLISNYGRVPGSYDYAPNLAIDDRRDEESTPNRYYKLPTIMKRGSRPSPTHTPFPEYQMLRHHETYANKPYTLPLFSD